MNTLTSYLAVSELHIIAIYYSYIRDDFVLLKINVELIFCKIHVVDILLLKISKQY